MPGDLIRAWASCAKRSNGSATSWPRRGQRSTGCVRNGTSCARASNRRWRNCRRWSKRKGPAHRRGLCWKAESLLSPALDHGHVLLSHRSHHGEANPLAAGLQGQDQADHPDHEPDDVPDDEQESNGQENDGQNPQQDPDCEGASMDDNRLGGVVLDVGVVLPNEQEDQAPDRREKGPREDRVQILVASSPAWWCTHRRRLAGGRWWHLRHSNQSPPEGGLLRARLSVDCPQKAIADPSSKRASSVNVLC